MLMQVGFELWQKDPGLNLEVTFTLYAKGRKNLIVNHCYVKVLKVSPLHCLILNPFF